jgi:putative transposase
VALIEAFQKAEDGNFLRSLAETVLQILMEAEVEGLIGAGRYERSGERSTYRNGYRERTLDPRLGSLNLKIPKLRTGSDFPGFLEPRKTAEKALVAVIQEAWIASRPGASTISCRRWACRASRRPPCRSSARRSMSVSEPS